MYKILLMTTKPFPRVNRVCRRLERIGAAWTLPILLLSIMPVSVMADQWGYFHYTTNGSAVTITKYTGKAGAVEIPNVIKSMPVVCIGESAFYGCTSLTNVTFGLPSAVTSILGYAFNSCTNLARIAIPGSVTNIGDYAFSLCSLPSVTIPSGVTSLGNRVFSYCDSLTNITVDTGNTAFSSADGVLFNKSQTTLIQCPSGRGGSYAIPSGVASIGDSAFLWCTRLASVTIPGGVTNIGDSAFSSCTNLTGIALPSSATNIGSYAFYSCGLRNFTIPSGVTSIASSTFAACSNLTSVTIPSSVTNIGSTAFYSCPSLTSVCFLGNAPGAGSSVFDYDNKATVYYLAGTTGWGSTFAGRPTVLSVPPAISVQPQDTSATVGSNATFRVTVTGAPPPSYQWQFNSVNIPGATGSSYVKSHVETNDAGLYFVVVTNFAGSVTSSNATLTVNVPPAITTQPQSVSVGIGSTVTFTVAATGTSPLSFQWRFNSTNLAGATDSSYTCDNVQIANVGSYSVVVSNIAGTLTSADAVLALIQLLPLKIDSITLMPAGQIQLQASGPPGSYAVEASPNLVDWVGLTNLITTGTSFQYVDSETNLSRRFYRLHRLPLPQPIPLKIDSINLMPAGQIQLQASGPPGHYAIEGTTNLADWAELTNFITTGTSFQYLDSAANLSRRFYRVQRIP